MERRGAARLSGVSPVGTGWFGRVFLAGACCGLLPAAAPGTLSAQEPAAVAPTLTAPAGAPAPAAVPAARAEAAAPGPAADEPWVIGIYPRVEEREIVTAERVVATTAAPGEAAAPAPVTTGPVVPAAYPCPSARMSYKDAYEQVPFSRAEYEANPGYRHEAAMELVFGVQRPTTIVKQTMPYFSRYPDSFRYRYPVYPYPANYPNRIDLNTYWHQQWYW